MNFLHYELNISSADVIQVNLDKQANVKLLDTSNFQKYRAGQEYRFHGGLAKQSPINIQAPHAGHWHLVIDLGGYSGTVGASVRVI